MAKYPRPPLGIGFPVHFDTSTTNVALCALPRLGNSSLDLESMYVRTALARRRKGLLPFCGHFFAHSFSAPGTGYGQLCCQEGRMLGRQTLHLQEDKHGSPPGASYRAYTFYILG